MFLFQCDYKSKYCILDKIGNNDVFFSVLKLSERKHKVEFVSSLCVCPLIGPAGDIGAGDPGDDQTQNQED